MKHSISYPRTANQEYYEIENKSFWFKIRNKYIWKLIKMFPPQAKNIVDVGGGNGFVAQYLQRKGLNVTLIEPGPGARNAKKRGIKNIINTKFSPSLFKKARCEAIGCFDVLEHINDDKKTLRQFYNALKPGGHVYITVPANMFFWSNADIEAMHYRRYSINELKSKAQLAGFQVAYITKLFSFLAIPLLLKKLKDFFTRQKFSITTLKKRHIVPKPIEKILEILSKMETEVLIRRKKCFFGTSIFCVLTKKI